MDMQSEEVRGSLESTPEGAHSKSTLVSFSTAPGSIPSRSARFFGSSFFEKKKKETVRKSPSPQSPRVFPLTRTIVALGLLRELRRVHETLALGEGSVVGHVVGIADLRITRIPE